MGIISNTNIFLAVALDEPEKDNIIQLTSADRHGERSEGD